MPFTNWLTKNAPSQTTVPGNITAAAATIVVASSSTLPVPTNGQKSALLILDTGNPGYLAANPYSTPYEYVYLTLNTTGTNTLTVARGQEGTAAQAFFAGATISHTVTAGVINSAVTGVLTQVQTITLASPANAFTFTGIPQYFSHLKIMHTGQSDQPAGASMWMQFNNDSGGDYAYQTILGNGSGATGTSSLTEGRIGTVAAGAESSEITIWRYASTTAEDTYKRAISWGTRDATPPALEGFAYAWKPATSTAINQINLVASAGNFLAGSTATLYGMP